MFPKENRLDRKSFKQIFKHGKRKYFSGFNLLFLNDENLKNSKIGIIISSSVFKKAVLRNKLKRRTRSVILEFLKHEELKYRLIFIFKKESAFFSYTVLKKEIEKSLKLLKKY